MSRVEKEMDWIIEKSERERKAKNIEIKGLKEKEAENFMKVQELVKDNVNIEVKWRKI